MFFIWMSPVEVSVIRSVSVHVDGQSLTVCKVNELTNPPLIWLQLYIWTIWPFCHQVQQITREEITAWMSIFLPIPLSQFIIPFTPLHHPTPQINSTVLQDGQTNSSLSFFWVTQILFKCYIFLWYFDCCLSAADREEEFTLCHDIKCLQTQRKILTKTCCLHRNSVGDCSFLLIGKKITNNLK